MKLVFATNNTHKIEEVRHILERCLPKEKTVQLQGLKEIGCEEELPETGKTLEENAAQKARYVFTHYKTNCFADDTGLEIVALNGRPGVYSARYAGEEKSADKNVRRVLDEMSGKENRKAIFKTVISLILNNKSYLFEGIIEGVILTGRKGGNGFGYDPIFMPDGQSLSFAEMSMEDKNKISHRAMAIQKLVDFLNTI